jgi:hypothetical protein
MSATQQVRDVLARSNLPEAGADRAGYHVEEGHGDTAIVRWGRGEPFHDVPSRPLAKDGLTACQDALEVERFDTRRVSFANPTGVYLLVTKRP